MAQDPHDNCTSDLIGSIEDLEAYEAGTVTISNMVTDRQEIARLMEDTVDPVRPGDWLASLNSAERKEIAIERGLYAYFPDALAAVARHSVRSNAKHNPGQPLHWARGKSADQGDCLARHHIAVAVDPSSLDDGQPHIIARAWRALADLQLWIEARHARGEKV